ncbi:MAG TPA: WD40 repeat domain-containing protein [Lacunisphaera sp.]|jgi:WD40 repeat protein
MSVERSELNFERSPADAAAVRPWLGLDSFTEETKAYFFGRDDEAAELGRRVQRKLLTVLFGQSGLGKTSILRAGIVPRLRPEGYCPIYVRIAYSADAPSPAEQIKTAVREVTTAAGTWSHPGSARAGESLWEFFHHRDDILRDAAGRTLTPLLIFDQFEEIFTLAQTDDAGRARATAFLAELADLVENRASAAIENDETAAERFDFSRADYRVLIALREDYLANLEALKDRMPSITQNRVRLTRMTGAPALEAVVRPVPGLVSDEVARQIVRFVSGAQDLSTAEIEPSLLSLVCRELNEMRIAKGEAVITGDLLAGSRESILGEFYERSLAGQPPGVRHFIEDVLLTDSGYRESVAEERVQKAFVAAGALSALTALVDRRLLRIEERLDVRRVELTHDVLCSVVKLSRQTRQQREAKERVECELAVTRTQEAATQRAMWRARMVALSAAVLCVFAIGSAIFGYRNMVRAREQERVAHTIAYSSGMIVARQVLDDGNLGRTKTILENQRPSPGEPDLRGWEWRYLWGQTRSDAEAVLYHDPAGGEICSVAVSPDGKLAAMGTLHLGGVVVMDLATRRTIATLAPERLFAFAVFSPTEPLLAFVTTEFDLKKAHVELWNTQTRERMREWSVDGVGIGLAFSGDGHSLILSTSTNGPEGALSIWNVSNGAKVAGISVKQPNLAVGTAGLAATADLRLAAYCSNEKGLAVTVVNVRTGVMQWTVAAEQPYVTALAFSPDGSLLATAEGFGKTDVRLWDVASGQLVGRLSGHGSWIGQIVFWPDGSKIATAGADQTIRTWDVATRKEIDVMRGHENEVWRLTLLPDHLTLMSGSKDGVVALWDTSKLHPRQARIDGAKEFVAGAWSADGRFIFAVDKKGHMERWSGDALERGELLFDLGKRPVNGRFSGDGMIYVDKESEHSLAVWDISNGKVKNRISLSHPDMVVDRVFVRRGTVVVYQPNGDFAQEIALADGKVIATWSKLPGIGSVTTSNDERFTVIGFEAGGFIVQDAETNTRTRVAADYLEPNYGTFSPDGRLFALSSRLGYVRIWETATWKEVGTLRGFINGAGGIAFSPDGKRLATGDGSGSQAVRVWDTASWEEVLTLRAPGSVFNSVSFSPDGNRIMAVSNGGIPHLWTAPSWEEIDRAPGAANAQR